MTTSVEATAMPRHVWQRASARREATVSNERGNR